ncbi:hypothetical protein J2W42_006206 [Rhizobium tibeticum]|uniref:hypothetical protein n=1 Tax=Rhizobium tibeticum TaxID=501024 RepID=UPI002783C5C1|nr:hypothetical protein [Rhizobium tibeticum]MDP9813333.1 hypothetical protein [Rhizobium tibeticum]
MTGQGGSGTALVKHEAVHEQEARRGGKFLLAGEQVFLEEIAEPFDSASKGEGFAMDSVTLP